MKPAGTLPVACHKRTREKTLKELLVENELYENVINQIKQKIAQKERQGLLSPQGIYPVQNVATKAEHKSNNSLMKSLQNMIPTRIEPPKDPVVHGYDDDDMCSRVTYKSSILTNKSTAFVPAR